MDNELKPCPFCGATAKHWMRTNYDDRTYVEHYILCDRCRASVGPYSEPRSAKKGWNRRAKDEQN